MAQMTFWQFAGEHPALAVFFVVLAASVAVADLAELEAEARGACCPSCLYGSRYTWLADKQERAEEWLRILKGRPE